MNSEWKWIKFTGADFASGFLYSAIKNGFPSCKQTLDKNYALILGSPWKKNWPSFVLPGQQLEYSLSSSWDRGNPVNEQ